MVFDEEYEANRLKELKLWLAENVIDIPEPQEVTLFDFEINWSKWSGDFKVRFDEFECQDTFGLAMEMTGFPKFYFPMFTSPLGVPASYRAIEITSNTHKAISEALRLTFPKLKPLGRNRVTGIEITYQSAVEDRLSREALEETRSLVVEDYSVTVRLEDMGFSAAQLSNSEG
mgnify:CR=1 FL=1